MATYRHLLDERGPAGDSLLNSLPWSDKMLDDRGGRLNRRAVLNGTPHRPPLTPRQWKIRDHYPTTHPPDFCYYVDVPPAPCEPGLNAHQVIGDAWGKGQSRPTAERFSSNFERDLPRTCLKNIRGDSCTEFHAF